MNNIKDVFNLSNGVKIPCLGFGTWQIPNNDVCFYAVTDAIKSGYTHIDTASIYKNEQQVGLAVKKCGVPREELFITSKLWNDDQGYESTLSAFEATMNRLNLEYLDLYLIHWPIPSEHEDDYEDLNLQTWQAFEKLYKDGRIKSIGVSNFNSDQLKALIKKCEINPMVNQIEFHPGLLQQDTVQFCKDNNILVEAWSPLCCGRIFSNKDIKSVADKYSRPVSQITLRWILQKGILPLPKSINLSRIEENSEIFDFEIKDDDVKFIDNIVFNRN